MEMILVCLAAMLLGAVISFFVSKKILLKYLEENNPINEQMIRMMFMQSGQKPSQKKINHVMKELEKATTKKK
jgi:uncharacterized protein YneF (UPF0154 family)